MLKRIVVTHIRIQANNSDPDSVKLIENRKDPGLDSQHLV